MTEVIFPCVTEFHDIGSYRITGGRPINVAIMLIKQVKKVVRKYEVYIYLLSDLEDKPIILVYYQDLVIENRKRGLTSAIARAVILAPRIRSCATGSRGRASRIARNTRLDINPRRR